MKPLTKDDFHKWDDEYPNELMIDSDNPKELADQILKNQEDAEFGRNWKQFLEDNPMIIREYPEFSKIIERLKKRLGELKDFRDNAPQYEGSGTVEVNKRLLIQLQEILGEKNGRI